MFMECSTTRFPWELRENLVLEPVMLFGVNGYLFICHIPLEKLEKDVPRTLQDLNWANRIEIIDRKMKWVCMSLLLWLNKVITVNSFIAKDTVLYLYVYIHMPSINLEEIGFTLCLKNRFTMNKISICIYLTDRYG